MRVRVPGYRKHSSGNARVTIRGKDYILGPYNSAESRQKYQQLIAEYLANGFVRDKNSEKLTLALLFMNYLCYAKTYYGPDSGEISEVKVAIDSVLNVYDSLLVDEFRVLQFRTVRAEAVKKGWIRSTVNRRMLRLLRIFKWATTEELMDYDQYSVLSLIEPLKKGRCECPESTPVKPVPDGPLNAVLSRVSPVIKSMIQLQRLTGSRPGELCNLRPADIDRSEVVWKATLREHKTAHHDKSRTLFFGPLAQQLLAPYLDRDPDLPCFSPKESYEWNLQLKSANRVIPKSYGNSRGTNKVKRPKREPGDAYTTASYRRVIHRVCKEIGIEQWSPNQLRHLRATEIRKEFGVEAAQLMLGHSSLNTTLIYAERDEAKLVQIAMQSG